MDTKSRTTLADLLTAGVIGTGEVLEWRRKGDLHRATVTADGQVQLEDGRSFASPSTAAVAAAGDVKAVNGWVAWRVVREGATLAEMRSRT